MNKLFSMRSDSFSDRAQMEWLGRSIDATTPIQVAAVIVELVEAQPGCIKAMVVWITADGGYTHVVPATAPSSFQLAQAQASLQILLRIVRMLSCGRSETARAMDAADLCPATTTAMNRIASRYSKHGLALTVNNYGH